MKTLELDLKKKVLIVQPEETGNMNYWVTLYSKDWDFICLGSELTEEIASELVENKTKHKFENKVLTFYNYKNLELFISAVESEGFHWLENPIEKPKYYDKILTRNCLIWQEAEAKTFRNPLIFVKKVIF